MITDLTSTVIHGDITVGRVRAKLARNQTAANIGPLGSPCFDHTFKVWLAMYIKNVIIHRHEHLQISETNFVLMKDLEEFLQPIAWLVLENFAPATLRDWRDHPQHTFALQGIRPIGS